MAYRGKPKFGLSGEMAEVELFGEVGYKINIDWKTWLEKNHELYLPRERALQIVKENQPGDPRDPNPKFASDVYESIVKRLLEAEGKENTPENYFAGVERVEFFTGVHSPLDYAHGIDAFFEINLDENNFIRITLNASTHNKADEDLKANILVEYPPQGLDPKEDKADWDALVAKIAEEIIEAFNAKIKSHEVNRRQRQNQSIR